MFMYTHGAIYRHISSEFNFIRTSTV